MAKQTRPEVVGVTVLKAPGGGLVIVTGPLDLSRAETLSPHWTRDVMATKPGEVFSEPDGQGNVTRRVVPVSTKVDTLRVHGESPQPAARRLNKESGKLLNAALLGDAVTPNDLLDALIRKTKTPRKPIQETPKDKRIRAERAMGFLGKPDVVVARLLKAAGRSPEAIEKYLRERAA